MSIRRVLNRDGVLPVVHLKRMLPAEFPQFGVWVWCLLPGAGASFLIFTYTSIHQTPWLWLQPIISALCSQLCLHLSLCDISKCGDSFKWDIFNDQSLESDYLFFSSPTKKRMFIIPLLPKFQSTYSWYQGYKTGCLQSPERALHTIPPQ